MPGRKKTRSSTSKPRPGRGGRTKTARAGSTPRSTAGKHLVIVESPAKAKTINRYLGPDFVVRASVGHVRDLPARAPKGSKQPVPGVDIENQFTPTYVVLSAKKKVVAELKKAAKDAVDIWFATDLDREGEAIAWHLTQVLGIDATQAKRVVFNAITRSEITRAFEHPHALDLFKVNAQQARRILDRIVGYQVSPLLWRKVARGLSAGRVQSVATRLVVEREREIHDFVPDEIWKVTARLALEPDLAASLASQWQAFISEVDQRDKGPTLKAQNAWLADHGALRAELVELAGEKFQLGCPADAPADLSDRVRAAAEAVGLTSIDISSREDPDGKGPAKTVRQVEGQVDPAARYRVRSIETKQTTSRPNPPFITSTLQMAASTVMGYSAQRTMRTAQALYEGVNIPGEGQVGLITYMRTDSTHLSNEAIADVRAFIENGFGSAYLPGKPVVYGNSGTNVQEAHEAIRPTEVRRHPDELQGQISEDQLKLYRLIWNRFVACQMTPARWDATAVLLERADQPTGAVFRTTGRVLTFDGFYRVAGVPTAANEQTLPTMRPQQTLAPFSIDADQTFSSPPPRYTEASLVKKLESEGIGRPSTYASIIQVIQDRNYVEQIDRRFHATDLGEMVTDKLIEAFPRLMDLSYTRQMESELDKIEDQHQDWVAMLEAFYARFSEALETAHETMVHAKAEIQPAPYKCPECGSRTCYRFGKNGRFLSCSAYPECHYAAPIDRAGRAILPERVNLACPADGSPMVLRTGRFGKFLASVNYPDVKYVVNLDKKGQVKYPARPPVLTDLECEKCGSPLNLRRGKRGPWLGCSTFPKCRGRMAFTKLEEARKQALLDELHEHELKHPQVELKTLDGRPVPEGTPISELLLPGGVADLDLHPDAENHQIEAA